MESETHDPGFLNGAKHQANKAVKFQASQFVLFQLYDAGLDPATSRSLDFCFYTNTDAKAKGLIGIGNRKGNRFGSRKGNRSVGQAKGYQVKMGKLQERAYSHHLEGSCRCSKWKTTN